MAYDGASPVDLERARGIFGNIDFERLPMGSRRVVVAVVGGRAGKTYLLVALRLLHGMLVRDLSALAPGEQAFATVVAPNDKLRQQAINYALGAARSKDELRGLLRLPRGSKADSVASEFGIYREDVDRIVTFTGAVATHGGYGVRGKWHTDLALDEAAFFRDQSAKVNDRDIFEAGISRVLAGGQCIIASTPWAKSGLLYDLYRDNWSKPETALVAHAPTLALNESPLIREVVELELKRNPENALREYGAEFMESGTTTFFESSTVDGALSDEPFELRAGDIVVAGADFGFRADSSALVMVAMRIEADGVPRLHVFDGIEERPGEDGPLKPSQTVESFAGVVAGRCSYVMADAHYRESIAEHLERFGLVYAPAPVSPVDTYIRARMLFREGRIRIHGLGFRARLVQQLREVQGRPTSGGGMAIVHPRWAQGGHGDIAAALMLALWQVSGDAVPEPVREEGTREWIEKQRDARQARMRERQERSDWMASGYAIDRGHGAIWKKRA